MNARPELLPNFTTNDELVGQRVWIEDGYGDGEEATVIAVSTGSYTIKVRADDGDVLVGNQWEPAGGVA